MDLNLIALGLLSILFIYLTYLYFTLPKEVIPIKPPSLWGEQVGRTRSIQSKTGDASMATELSRRRAIQQAGRLNKNKLKESRTSTGSSTGAFETFFLSAICPAYCPCPILPSVIFDAGHADDDFCPIFDGDYDNSIYYDGGGIDTQICGV